MKYLILLTFISFAEARSIVPERVVTPPLDIFSRHNKALPEGDVVVRVTSYSKRGEFRKRGASKVLRKSEYDSYRGISEAVFEMIPNNHSFKQKRNARRGTAFSVGENLVLTNAHVLDESMGNTTRCDDFEVRNHMGETFPCQEVHFCSVKHDVCLIEMKAKIKVKRECVFCPGVRYEVSLAQGPSLKLLKLYHPGVLDWSKVITSAIGNSAGLGIHFSQGQGIYLTRERVYFYAPITKGNSGGPLLNQDGLVIGVVKQQSKITNDVNPNKAYNVAVPSELVIELVREALHDKPETLEKFNRSVVE